MAAQTKKQRSEAAKKAAETRKKNAEAAEENPGAELKPSDDSPLASDVEEKPSVDAADPAEDSIPEGKFEEDPSDRKLAEPAPPEVEHLVTRDSTKPDDRNNLQSIYVEKD